jgi:hypothetical protein
VVNASGDSGYSYNRFTDNHLGKVDSKAARVQLEWKPSDAFSLRLMYNYGDSESEQALLQHVGVRAAGNTGVTCTPVIEAMLPRVPARICWAISTTTASSTTARPTSTPSSSCARTISPRRSTGISVT